MKRNIIRFFLIPTSENFIFLDLFYETGQPIINIIIIIKIYLSTYFVHVKSRS